MEDITVIVEGESTETIIVYIEPSGALPAGGTAGQILTKVDNQDFNADWEDPTAGGGTVESVNGILPDINKNVQIDYSDVGADQAGSANTAETNAKTYADSLVVGLWDDRGNYDPTATSTYPVSGGSGTAGIILKGDIWTVSVNGIIAGTIVKVGDTVRALSDSPGVVSSNWSIAPFNIGYVPENVANKDTANGYVGLDSFKIKFRNLLNTFTSFLTNYNTAPRTYLLPDRDGTLADNTDLANKQDRLPQLISGGGITIVPTNIARVAVSTYYIPGIGTFSSPQTDFPLTLAAPGNIRYVGFYGNSSSGVTKVEGPEGSIGTYPDTPINTTFIKYVEVTDAGIGPGSGPSTVPIITTLTTSTTPLVVLSSDIAIIDYLVLTGQASAAQFQAPAVIDKKRWIIKVKDNNIARALTYVPLFANSTFVILPPNTTVGKWTSIYIEGNGYMNKWVVMATNEA